MTKESLSSSIKKISVQVPGEVWTYQVGEMFWGYVVTGLSHWDEYEYHHDRIFMYGEGEDGETRLLRIFNYNHVICEDYV